MKPFFSIGVPTYNRRELLKETLNSILNQTFSDYEVVVSNDYTEEKFSLSELGIDDPRFQLVNQEKNLGPWKNHNYLVERSQGKYFAWLADDDCIMSNFLESMYVVLNSYDVPLRVFTAYCGGTKFSNSEVEVEGKVRTYEGEGFLKAYLSREIKTVGHYGIFNREYLIESGGLENLGKGIYSPYNDNLLAIKAGLLDKVVYVDSPLLFFREHHGSASHSSIDIDSFVTAQEDFLARCKWIINNEKVKRNAHLYLYYILRWIMRDIFAVVRRGNSLLPQTFMNHLMVLNRYAKGIGWHYAKFITLLVLYGAEHFVWKLRPRGK